MAEIRGRRGTVTARGPELEKAVPATIYGPVAVCRNADVGVGEGYQVLHLGTGGSVASRQRFAHARAIAVAIAGDERFRAAFALGDELAVRDALGIDGLRRLMATLNAHRAPGDRWYGESSTIDRGGRA